MGFYLEETTKCVNYVFKPLTCVEITGSIIRNYVKMGPVSNPVKKQYGANQIAHLLCVTLLKQVMPLDYISQLFERQKVIYTDPIAYVDTAGRNKKAIRAYIKNQLQEDQIADQVSIKEFVDPFTGSKNTKA